jgi:hypothetical protein
LIFRDFEAELAFLNASWTFTDCDEDELELEYNGIDIELDKECENEISCDLQDVYDVLQNCKWEADSELLSTELEYLVFDDQGNIFLYDDPLNDIGDFNFSIVGSQLFLELNFSIDYTVLNGQWQITECDDEYLIFVRGSDFLELDQDCSSNDPEFACFEEKDGEITQCDNGTDGPYFFDLSTEFEDCLTANTFISYHQTFNEADTNTNPIGNPQSYQLSDTDATVYARVVINNEVEVFDIYLEIEDCGNEATCSQDDIRSYLISCDWTPENFNGSDTLKDFELSFEEDEVLEIENTETNETFEGAWELVINEAEISLVISGINEAVAQAINGEWVVSSCSLTTLELQKVDQNIVLESDCQ